MAMSASQWEKNQRYVKYVRDKEKSLRVDKKKTAQTKGGRRRKANAFASTLQKRRTQAERVLIEMLEHYGIRFLFQKPFHWDSGFCIVDFYFPENNVVVEIDGPSHDNTQKEDERRTQNLYNHCNIKVVLRYKNEQLYNSPFDVLNDIIKHL